MGRWIKKWTARIYLPELTTPDVTIGATKNATVASISVAKLAALTSITSVKCHATSSFLVVCTGVKTHATEATVPCAPMSRLTNLGVAAVQLSSTHPSSAVLSLPPATRLAPGVTLAITRSGTTVIPKQSVLLVHSSLPNTATESTSFARVCFATWKAFLAADLVGNNCPAVATGASSRVTAGSAIQSALSPAMFHESLAGTSALPPVTRGRATPNLHVRRG